MIINIQQAQKTIVSAFMCVGIVTIHSAVRFVCAISDDDAPQSRFFRFIIAVGLVVFGGSLWVGFR